MPNPLTIRFAPLWRRLGAKADPEPIANDLVARWSEPWRHYHTAAHLEACLAQLDAHRTLAHEPDLVEIAIWFHDAIYAPRASDNEARSAELAKGVLSVAGVSENFRAKVERLVLATRFHQTDEDPDTALLLDIDLSILGADYETYAAYADAIRREFDWVPAPEFRSKRAAVLSRFLQRPRLFLTAPFSTRLEYYARANLAHEIQRLSGA
jgi:predicted metal-dependent HD superfamily phosphohydrolase